MTLGNLSCVYSSDYIILNVNVQEHHYHVLENVKKTIPPDPDIPELPPLFKPKPSPPPIYIP